MGLFLALACGLFVMVRTVDTIRQVLRAIKVVAVVELVEWSAYH
jgi:hypothetical protein